MTSALETISYDTAFAKVDSRETAMRRFAQLESQSTRLLHPLVNKWFAYTRRTVGSGISEIFKQKLPAELTERLVDWALVEAEGVAALKPAILAIIGKGGNAALKIAGESGRFDTLTARTIKAAEEQCAHLVVEVTEETKAGIRTLLVDAARDNQTAHSIGMELRNRVGLTEKQMGWVANFEERLLIDRPELSAKQIQRRVATYEKKTLRYRTETIARTESARALSEGELQGYEQAGRSTVIFLASSDACNICTGMNGDEYTIDHAHGVQPVHPRCRCDWMAGRK